MKNILIYLPVVFLAALLTACDENEIMPSYKKVGTSTSTVVMIGLPETVYPADMVEVDVSFVNPSEDPLQSIVLRVQLGDGEFVDVQTWDVSGESIDQLATKTANYQAPATVGTKVTFEVVINSGKEFPQRKQSSFTVKAP